MSTTPINNDPADPDEILHHITVADVETLHGMVLTEDQAEQVKEALAQALTDAINKIRGIREYRVRYEIRTGIDGSVVAESECFVSGTDRKTATSAAIAWVHDNDARYDDRIDPRVAIISVTRS